MNENALGFFVICREPCPECGAQGKVLLDGHEHPCPICFGQCVYEHQVPLTEALATLEAEAAGRPGGDA